LSSWDSEEFGAAIEAFSKEITIIEKAQEEEKHSIHKGAAFYNLGLSLALYGKMNDAIHNFLLAYIEDTLSNHFGEEDEADGAPAYRILRNFFRLNIGVISEINKKSRQIKEEGKWKETSNPELILKEIAQLLGFELTDFSKWVKVLPEKLSKKVPLGFPQPWEQRVFVGGAYRIPDSMKALYKIKDAIRRKDFRYVPIMGDDIYIDKEIRHRTLLLMHTCKWAIFEVTYPAGQLVEIERSLDYETRLLILYKKENGKMPESVSLMTRTIPHHRTKFEGYDDIEEILSIVGKFLPKFEDADKD
jgi:hypothetical protein